METGDCVTLLRDTEIAALQRSELVLSPSKGEASVSKDASQNARLIAGSLPSLACGEGRNAGERFRGDEFCGKSHKAKNLESMLFGRGDPDISDGASRRD